MPLHYTIDQDLPSIDNTHKIDPALLYILSIDRSPRLCYYIITKMEKGFTAMKKIALVLIAIALIACVIGQVYKLNAYTLTDSVVIEISGDSVLAVDSNGNCWEFFADGLTLGDNITLVMNNHHTANVIDDSVINYF